MLHKHLLNEEENMSESSEDLITYHMKKPVAGRVSCQPQAEEVNQCVLLPASEFSFHTLSVSHSPVTWNSCKMFYLPHLPSFLQGLNSYLNFEPNLTDLGKEEI